MTQVATEPAGSSLDPSDPFPYDAIDGEARTEAAAGRGAPLGDRADARDDRRAGALAARGGREGDDAGGADPAADEPVGEAGGFTEGQREFIRWLVEFVIRKRDQEVAAPKGEEVA